MQRVPVPEEKKDNKYWERRRKNNEAAKKSRNLRRKKMDDELRIAKEAIQENQKLKQEIDVSYQFMSTSHNLSTIWGKNMCVSTSSHVLKMLIKING